MIHPDYARRLITDWIRDYGPQQFLLGAYDHLVSEGVSRDDAIEALKRFVDDVITLKTSLCGACVGTGVDNDCKACRVCGGSGLKRREG